MCMSKRVRHLEELAITGTGTLVCLSLHLCVGRKWGEQESSASYWMDCVSKASCWQTDSACARVQVRGGLESQGPTTGQTECLRPATGGTHLLHMLYISC